MVHQARGITSPRRERARAASKFELSTDADTDHTRTTPLTSPLVRLRLLPLRAGDASPLSCTTQQATCKRHASCHCTGNTLLDRDCAPSRHVLNVAMPCPMLLCAVCHAHMQGRRAVRVAQARRIPVSVTYLRRAQAYIHPLRLRETPSCEPHSHARARWQPRRSRNTHTHTHVPSIGGRSPRDRSAGTRHAESMLLLPRAAA